MESVNVRNLEQIQEDDVKPDTTSRFTALLLASLGGAALVIVAVTMAKRAAAPAATGQDPLAALVASAKAEDREDPRSLDGTQVTFPRLLSDSENVTTALAAVKNDEGQLVEQSGSSGHLPGAPSVPPQAADRLPVVPLPAGTLLDATSVTTQPKDDLTALAAKAAEASGDFVAPAGVDTGYQIQVASFKEQQDADAFVAELRKRGHAAFRQAAYVAGRGLWHRVRIGPFDSKYEANQYRTKFEGKERMAPFVIDPHQVKQREEIRAAKVRAREQEDGTH